ncbi:hypothetical protein FB451DRAFT_1494412 [Mycena latifolia]|nr:hypothetical protein FB451DRAFT_1494412 [Mycena latifolia]
MHPYNARRFRPKGRFYSPAMPRRPASRNSMEGARELVETGEGSATVEQIKEHRLGGQQRRGGSQGKRRSRAVGAGARATRKGGERWAHGRRGRQEKCWLDISGHHDKGLGADLIHHHTPTITSWMIYQIPIYACLFVCKLVEGLEFCTRHLRRATGCAWISAARGPITCEPGRPFVVRTSERKCVSRKWFSLARPRAAALLS